MLPSPSKRAHMTSTVPPALRDPSDPRGSLQRVASVGVDRDAIVAKSVNGRYQVSQRALGIASAPTAPSARGLGKAHTESSLSFAASQQQPQYFTTPSQINESVYSVSHKPGNELQPFYATSDAGSSRRGGDGSALFSESALESQTRETTMEVGEDDGDGFDPDEVFGGGGGGFGSSFGTGAAKRSRGDEEAEEEAGTDVEDDGMDVVPDSLRTSFFLNSSSTQLGGGRRGFSRTTSLPASAFSSTTF